MRRRGLYVHGAKSKYSLGAGDVVLIEVEGKGKHVGKITHTKLNTLHFYQFYFYFIGEWVELICSSIYDTGSVLVLISSFTSSLSPTKSFILPVLLALHSARTDITFLRQQ